MEITFGMMFSQVAGLFALLVIGYWLNRRNVLPREAETVLSRISTRLFLPSLMIYTFMEECNLENLQKFSSLIVYGCVFILVSILVACLIAKPLEKKNEYIADVYRYAMAFPNTGGFGTPIVLAMFGHSGLFQYQLFLLLNVVLCYSWGTSNLMPKEHRGGWRKRIRSIFNTVQISILFGAFLGLTGIGRMLPDAVPNTLQNLGSCFSVVSLLLTGYVIGDYPIKEVIADKLTYLMAFIKLLAIPGAFLLVLKFLDVPDMVYTMTCLTYGCPCGMNSVVYPAAYGRDTRPGTSLVLITSSLAVFTIPFLFLFM